MKRKIKSLLYIGFITVATLAVAIPVSIRLTMPHANIIIHGGIVVSSDAQWPAFPGITGGGTYGNPYIISDEVIYSPLSGGMPLLLNGQAISPLTAYVKFINDSFIQLDSSHTLFGVSINYAYHESFINCTFDGNDTSANLFVLGGGNNNFTGCKIIGMRASGEAFIFCSDSTFRDCLITGTYIASIGIVNGGNNNFYINNTISSLSAGMQSSNPVFIYNSTFYNITNRGSSGNALQLYSYAPASIIGCKFIANHVGLISCEAGDVLVKNCIFNYNQYYAIDFNISNAITVENCSFSHNGDNSHAVTYWQSNYFPLAINNSTFSNNLGVSIDAYGGNSVPCMSIENCSFDKNNNLAVRDYGSNGFDIENNNFSANNGAIQFIQTINSKILENTFNAYPDGLITLNNHATSITIVNNTFVSGINIIHNITSDCVFNVSNNYYLDFFQRYPNALCNMAKKFMQWQYQITTKINDTKPLYSDAKFPNSQTLSYLYIMASMHFDALTTKLYVDKKTLVSGDFAPKGICFRATFTDSTTNDTLLDRMLSTMMNYSFRLFITVITPGNHSTEKANFYILASVYNINYDISKAWISVYNESLGNFIENVSMTKIMQGTYQLFVQIYNFTFGDFTFVLHVNDSTNQKAIPVKLLLHFRQPEIIHYNESDIMYQSNEISTNKVITASIFIHHDGFLLSNETDVYLPSTWQNARNANIKRVGETFYPIPQSDPTLLQFIFDTWMPTDNLTFEIDSPLMIAANNNTAIILNGTTVALEYSIMANETYSNVLVVVKNLNEGWTWQLQIYDPEDGDWDTVDPLVYGFIAVNSTTCAFTVPNINPGEVLHFRILMTAPPAGISPLTWLWIGLGIAGGTAGIAVVGWYLYKRRRV